MRVSSLGGTPSFFRVSGTCGTGSFPEHIIAWELFVGQARNPLGSGEVRNPCDLGRFSVSIEPQPINQFVEGERYFLNLTIGGLDNGDRLDSSSISRSGSLDIILSSEDLSNSDAGYSPELQFCRQFQRQQLAETGAQLPTPACPAWPDLEASDAAAAAGVLGVEQ